MSNFSLLFKQYSKSVLLILSIVLSGLTAKAQGDAGKGQALFQANCTSCHKIDVRVTGPALGPQLVSETDDKFLIKWIQNNQALIAAKNPKAVTIYNQYQQTNMSVFPQLSDGDVTNIIAYVRTTWADMQKKQPSAGAQQPATDSGPSGFVIWALIAVIIIAFIVILVLNKVIATLERMMLKGKGLMEEDQLELVPVDRFATIKKLAKNKKLVGFVMLCGTLAFGSWTWVALWTTNVHQGYQPVQPIRFPHDLHAGAMQISCQYCHSGAYKAKNASIPSLNICMNCHKVVKTESPEIQKIYYALGYDVKTNKYDTENQHPVQWVRIHNLPDFAYFNHSQHTRVAGLKCQTCHGQVQEMREVYQYSPLTMKWCIQCHKRTDVNFKGNAYYQKMELVHDLIKQGKPVTEANMGGIECGKCHY